MPDSSNPDTVQAVDRNARHPLRGKNGVAETGLPSLPGVRLLIPVNGSENSLWAVKYALRLQSAGRSLEVVVLNVGEPVNQWQVMQFRTQQEIGQFQSRKAQSCIDEAIRPLTAGNVLCRGLFKQGEVVFSILDTAEELECDEIVLPRKKERWAGLFGRSIVQDIVRSQRSVPVVLVNNLGESA